MRLRDEPRFARLLTSDFVSGLGDQLNRVAVLALVYQVSRSGILVSIVLASRMLAAIITAPIGAILADRLPRREVLIASGLVRAVLAAAMVLLGSGKNIWLLIGMVAALEALSAVAAPARSALIPLLVRPPNLVWANGLDQGLFGLTMALGSLAAGPALALIGTSGAFIVNSASFVVSAALVVGLPRGGEHTASTQDTGLLAAFPTIWHSVSLRTAVLLSAAWPLAGGALSVLVTAYSFDIFHAGAFGIGLLYSALGTGYLVGGIVVGQALRRLHWSRQRIAVTAFCIEGLFYVVASLSPTIPVTALLLFCGTFSAAGGNAAIASMLMTAPNETLGRVLGTAQGLARVGQITSMLAGGAALNVASPRAVGFVSGSLLIVTVAAIGSLSTRLQREPKSVVS